MTKFTPVFARDGNTFIVPEADFVQETAELADVAGIGAGLAAEYGLNYTGRVEELSDDGKYPGPYVTATIRDKQALIISGQSLVDAVLSGAAENIPATPTTTTSIATSAAAAVAAEVGGDHTGPDTVDAV